MMKTPEAAERLNLGIEAVKTGQRVKAKELLIEIIEQDEENEQAWLWLSSVVDTNADKQVCLENVLTLNPQNQSAQKGLTKLRDSATSSRQTVRREITPSNLAGTILYQERHNQEWEWHDPTPDRQIVTNLEIIQESSYKDIWERDDELCAFCAQTLAGHESTCPRCKKGLITQIYRYSQPDTYLHIFWVMLVAIGQLYFLQAIYDIVVTREFITAVLPIIMMVVFTILAAGVYFRQYWAYIGAIILLIIILAINIIGMLIPAELTQITLINTSPIIDNVVNPAISLISTALHGFQLLTLALALGIAVLKAGPDFERVEMRHNAKLEKGLQTAGSYHGAAQRAAKQGEWATAVLHWQRAAAKAPANRQFQRQLGIAYARLGFYQRSADVLQSALRITSDPEQQAQLNRLLTTVQKHINEENG